MPLVAIGNIFVEYSHLFLLFGGLATLFLSIITIVYGPNIKKRHGERFVIRDFLKNWNSYNFGGKSIIVLTVFSAGLSVIGSILTEKSSDQRIETILDDSKRKTRNDSLHIIGLADGVYEKYDSLSGAYDSLVKRYDIILVKLNASEERSRIIDSLNEFESFKVLHQRKIKDEELQVQFEEVIGSLEYTCRVLAEILLDEQPDYWLRSYGHTILEDNALSNAPFIKMRAISESPTISNLMDQFTEVTDELSHRLYLVSRYGVNTNPSAKETIQYMDEKLRTLFARTYIIALKYPSLEDFRDNYINVSINADLRPKEILKFIRMSKIEKDVWINDETY